MTKRILKTVLPVLILVCVAFALLCACGGKNPEKAVVTFDIESTLVAGDSMELKYTATESVESVTIRIRNQAGDDVTDSLYDSETNIFSPTEAGIYSIIVEVRSTEGKSESKTLYITVTAASSEDPELPKDTEDPVITFNTADSLTLGESLQVKYIATDNVAVVRVQLYVKDEADLDVTSDVYDEETKLFSPVSAGIYKIYVEAWDAAGNSATQSHVVTVTAVSEPGYALPSNPNYGTDVSVHDPSVFYDDATQQYYVFGSHFAVASSTDLLHWTQLANDGDSGKQLLFHTTNFRSVLSQADAIVHGNENIWAPHVEKIGGKYYMYYSLTSGFGSNKSVIGRVSSDNATGPYSNEEIIVWSEGLGTDPNCIDPELFYDKDGKLWMVYGSFFAGIYIKELNASTGLPIDSGVHSYGKLLWKGSSAGVEGPDIIYSEQTDYYYLVVSDGSLSTDYNMRVARSKNPDGPYLDITGANTATAYGYGNKLAGNYQFSDDGTGYAAMGGGSLTKKDGKYFVVFHTRYNDGYGNVTGGHNLQVRQIFFNEEDWPVLSPNRYALETLGKVIETDVAGTYDVVLHTTGNTQAFASSSRYTLAEDGTVKNGSLNAGNWTLTGDCFITVTIGGTAYKGVVSPAWSTYGGALLCFTATASDGRSLWANKSVSEAALSGLKTFKTVSGSVSSLTVDADELNVLNGFAVSFYLSQAIPTGSSPLFNDWNCTVVSCNDLRITLPNIVGAEGNLFPSYNGNYNTSYGTWDSFLNTTCYVTVSVSKTDGIQFYKNGVHTQNYPITAKLEDGSALSDFINELFSYIQTDGFVFADSSLIKAQNLVVTEAVTDVQARALYDNYGN